MLVRIFIFLGISLLSSPLCGQTDLLMLGHGLPFTQYYPPQTYEGHRQNWCMIQDAKGVMYIGNTAGLITFDGVKWRKYDCKNQSVIRCLAKDGSGNIYYGAKGDFGYISSDAIGELNLISLVDRLPENVKAFGDIWQITFTEKQVFFQARPYLMRFDLDQIHARPALSKEENPPSVMTPSGRGFSGLCVAKGGVYTQDVDIGLMKVVGDTLQRVPGGELPPGIIVDEIFPFNPSAHSSLQLALITLSNGIYLWDGDNISPKTIVPYDQSFFENNFVTSAAILSNGNLAIASDQKGLMLLDSSLQFIGVFDETNGLPMNVVNGSMMDHQEGLWVGTDNGLVRMETPGPFSFYSEKQGLKGNMYSVKMHRGTLYIGTNEGILKTEIHNQRFTRFERIDDLKASCYSLVSTSGDLLGAMPSVGVVQIQGEKISQLVEGIAVHLSASRYDERLVFIGENYTNSQDWMLYKTNNGWQPIASDQQIPGVIRYIEEEAPGIVWLGSRTQGYFRVEIPALKAGSPLSAEDTLHIKLEHISAETAVTGGRSRLFYLHDNLYFATNKGLKRFDPVSRTMIPDSSLGKVMADTSTKIFLMAEGVGKEIWVKTDITENTYGKLVLTPKGQYKFKKTPFMSRLEVETLSQMFSDPFEKEKIWLGGSGMLVKYDPASSRNYMVDFSALIRKVLVNGDSLIYSGDSGHSGPKMAPLDLSYKGNSLRFEYSAASFEQPEKNTFQVWLEPFDASWSEWTFETQKDYTNLPEGNYIFHVRAKNLYAVESQETVVTFQISPPWSRTIWAYILYALLAGGIIWQFVKIRERRFKAQNRALEEIISDRTQELAQKNEQLLEMDQVKSRFFTNISHEFRTPLTVISGMADMVSESEPRELIKRNSQSLLGLVNQILDLRKLESGKLTIDMQQGNVVPYLKYLTESFQSYAESREVELIFSVDSSEIVMDYDAEKLQSIIANLLSNAIKFTQKGGSVSLSVRAFERSKVGLDRSNNRTLEHSNVPILNTLAVSVTDTGKGISSEKLPFIFDRFYQVDDSSTRQGEGTGIGLTLTHELVKLFEGEISVASELGKGTQFQVQLPITQHAPPANGISAISQTETFPIVVQEAQNIPVGATDAYKLLIVEDNPDVTRYLQACLADAYQISIAKDGQEGIEKAIAEVPDIIISDVMMPRKDGFELCQTLKTDERTSHIPIVLLTAKADVESRISGLQRGADAYLAKPFNKVELMVRLEMLINLRQQLQRRYHTLEPVAPSGDEAIQQEDAFILKVRTTIEANLEDETFKTPELCLALGVSRTQLHNKIKALTGNSSSILIRSIRLHKAKDLLETSDLTVAEVAYATGYGNPNYFSRLFAEEFGQSPSVFRRKED